MSSITFLPKLTSMQVNMTPLVELLSKVPSVPHNELLQEALVSVPNIVHKHITIQFSGITIKLYPDGTWDYKDNNL